MNKAEQDTWNKAVRSHWWVRGHYDIIRSILRAYFAKNLLPGTVSLDIGCSGGHITEFLRGYGEAYGFDVSFDGLLHSVTKDRILRADAQHIPFKDKVFDVVTLFDVAEHVADDKALFNEISRVGKVGAIVAVNVPAYPCLWGEHDEWNGHKRRYVRRDIELLASACGFTIERMTYLHPHLFLPLFLHRSLGKRHRPGNVPKDDFVSFGSFVDGCLSATLALERRAVSVFSFPFGTSLFAILRKG